MRGVPLDSVVLKQALAPAAGSGDGLELAKVMGQNGHDGREPGSNGAATAAYDSNGAAAAAGESSHGPEFREAGALERDMSLHPGDPPPEPFVYRNLEEIAEKLGAHRGTFQTEFHYTVFNIFPLSGESRMHA